MEVLSPEKGKKGFRCVTLAGGMFCSLSENQSQWQNQLKNQNTSVASVGSGLAFIHSVFKTTSANC